MCEERESNPETAQPPVINGRVAGVPKRHGGQDLPGIDLVAGCTYRIRVRGREGGGAARGKVLQAPSRLDIHEDTGAWLVGATNGERNDAWDGSLTFTARRSGTHYVEAGAGRWAPDTIELNVSDTVASGPARESQLSDARADAAACASTSACASDSACASTTDLGDIADLDASRFPVTHCRENGEPVVFFRFTLTESRRVSLGLGRLTTRAQLLVEDVHGALICARSYSPDAGGWLSAALAPGTYRARVDVPEHGYRPFALRGRVAPPTEDAVRDGRRGHVVRHGGAAAPEPAVCVIWSDPHDGSRTRVSLGSVARAEFAGAATRYRLVGGNEAGLFELDGHTGELFFTGSESSFETGSTPRFELTVRSCDGERCTDHTEIVSVNRVPDPPETETAFDAASEPVAEMDADARISLGRVSDRGPDEPPLKYRLVAGNDAGLFELDETTGELFFTGSAEEFERLGADFELTVRTDAKRH